MLMLYCLQALAVFNGALPPLIFYACCTECHSFPTQGLSESEFLTTVPEDDETLADTRRHVKAAYYNLTIPYTTRPMREGEKNGREYNFVTPAEFKALIDGDRLLEYGLFNRHMYGTPKLGKDDAHPQSAFRLSAPPRTAVLQQVSQARRGDAKVSSLSPLSTSILRRPH